MIPFAVVGSDQEYQVNGRRLLGRKTKWGTIEGTTLVCIYINDALLAKQFVNHLLFSGFIKWGVKKKGGFLGVSCPQSVNNAPFSSPDSSRVPCSWLRPPPDSLYEEPYCLLGVPTSLNPFNITKSMSAESSHWICTEQRKCVSLVIFTSSFLRELKETGHH